MSRQISRLKWAEHAENPWPRRRLNGVKAKGISYEKRVAIGLRGYGARHNPWFRFEDANGPGMCCPDFVLSWQGQIIILECKLTDCIEAEWQLKYLYAPVVGSVYQCEPRCVVVAKILTPQSKVSHSLDEALAKQEVSTVHYLGRGSFPLRM